MKFTKTDTGGMLSIPSEASLLTIAQVTRCETDRMTAARKWLKSSVIGDREKHLLFGFWDLLDQCPEGSKVDKIQPRYTTYR